VESLKKASELDGMMAELSGYLPPVKTALIDERDRYLAAKIWQSSGSANRIAAGFFRAGTDVSLAMLLRWVLLNGSLAALRKQVSDAQNIAKDVGNLKGIYRNRISRALLVFFLSSLGGAIGNFIAIPSLAGLLAR
jgi:pheromone shutdown protein TraB